MITSQEKRRITLQAKELAKDWGKIWFIYTPERLEYFKQAFSRYTDRKLRISSTFGKINDSVIVELR